MRGFSWELSVGCFRPYGHDIGSRPRCPQVALSSGAAYALEPPRPSGGQPSFLRPPGFDAMRWYRNINLFSIAYAFRPRLRARLTPGGLTSPGGPWLSVWGVSLSRADVITRALPPRVAVCGIRSLVRFGNLVGPLAVPVLYLRNRVSSGDT